MSLPDEDLPRRHLLALLLVLASVLLHSPELSWEFLADDHAHELVLSGAFEHESMRPWALYDFGTLAEQLGQRDAEGTFPYWTPDHWRVKFLRPVASLVRWFEHVVTGGSAVGTHAFGLLWWGALLALAWRFFGALGLTPRAALWALAFLALESGAAVSVGWPANRNTVVEALFLVASLDVFLGAATWRGRLAALGLALLATLSKESGVVALPLLAWLAWRRGARAWIAPPLVCAAAYLAFYVLAGYGSNSPFYPAPWSAPGAWFARVGFVAPFLAVYATTPLSVDLTQLVPGLTGAFTVLGVLVWGTLGPKLRAATRALESAAFPWIFVLVTALPQAGAPPSDRLLLVPGIGVAALLGAFAGWVGERRAVGAATWFERAARGALVVALVLSAGALVQVAREFGGVTRFARAAIVAAEVGPRELGRRDALVLQAPTQLVGLQPRAAYAHATGDADVRFWTLSFSRAGVVFERTGEHVFELSTTGAPFFSGVFASVFLTDDVDLRVGDRWTNDVMTIRALELRDGRPVRVEVELRRSLDDPGLRFLRWRAPRDGEDGLGRWAHVPPPPVGEAVVIERAPAPLPFLP